MKKLIFLTFKFCIITTHLNIFGVQAPNHPPSFVQEKQKLQSYFENIFQQIPETNPDNHLKYSLIYSLLEAITQTQKTLLPHSKLINLPEFIESLNHFSSISIAPFFKEQLAEMVSLNQDYSSPETITLETNLISHRAFKMRLKRIDQISTHIQNQQIGIIMSYFMLFNEEGKYVSQSQLENHSLFIKINDEIIVIHQSSHGVELIPLSDWQPTYKQSVYERIGKHTEASVTEWLDGLSREDALTKYKEEKILDLNDIINELSRLNAPDFKKEVLTYMPTLTPLGISVSVQSDFVALKIEIEYLISRLKKMSLNEIESLLLSENEKLIKEVHPARFLTIVLPEIQLPLNPK